MKFSLFKIIAFLIVFFVGPNVQAQKVKIKKGLVTVDGQNYCKIEKVDGSNFYIKNLNDSNMFLLSFNSYKDPKEITSQNPNGIVRYLEIKNPVSGNILFEMRAGKKKVIKEFFKNEVITTSQTVHLENLQKLIALYGKQYSRKRSELNSIFSTNMNANQSTTAI